ncbi:BAG family molecular chaperone regulator 3 isoform X4 [Ochlerotatus camptorhynchus]|uniref:BAG family molecular chaperone regulator 3 isoform X4 n=1 Tax=Ochlerotatus camptorhynchus TaxID=644619 RepID=UPI0031DEEF67
MSEQIEQMSLPPGWDCRYDARTGRYYYVNLFTKTTSWEDPRARIRQLQTGAPLHISNDSISVQPVHGSPYHVYPSSNSFYPAQQAFQNPPSGVPSLTASPNLTTKLQQPQQQQQQPIELSPIVRSSPHTPRMGLGRNAMQETSFSSNVSAADTDATVAKINSMFPTVPETHIRMLLKKYLKSFFPKADEDLILDVLANADNNVQTASQQLIKLGYEKREQSGNQRSSSRKGSEKDGPSQSAADAKRAESQTPPAKPKTHEEKKKIKSRVQSKYKDIAERIILMALESVDYSEDRAKQILNIVIQEDREKKKSVKIDAPHKPEEDKENAQAGSTTPSRANSTSSNYVRPPKKGNLTPDGHPKATTIEGGITTGAAGVENESTAADNENATDASIEITTSTNSTAIINGLPQSPPQSPSQLQQQPQSGTSNGNQAQATGSTDLIDSSNSNNAAAAVASTSSAKPQYRTRAKTDHAKYSIFRSSSSEDDLDGPSQQTIPGDTMAVNIPRIASKGPNVKLFKGPNDDLLLADYVTWNGANPDLAKGTQKLALGPDRSIRLDRSYTARGPNSDLCKGPAAGLAKGSMYGQLNCSLAADVRCN